MLFIGSIRDRLSLVALTANEYVSALQASSDQGIVGGGGYDAILAHCALKAEAKTIYSWNSRHYQACGQEVIQRLRTP